MKIILLLIPMIKVFKYRIKKIINLLIIKIFKMLIIMKLWKYYSVQMEI